MGLKSIYLDFQENLNPEPIEVWERDGHPYPIKYREDGHTMFLANTSKPYVTHYNADKIKTVPGLSTESWAGVQEYVKKYDHHLAYYALSGGYEYLLAGKNRQDEFDTAIAFPDYNDFVEKFEILNEMSKEVKFLPVFHREKREKKGGAVEFVRMPPAICVHQSMFAENYRKRILEDGTDEWKARDMVKAYHKTHKLNDMIIEQCGRDVLEYLSNFNIVDTVRFEY